MLRSCARIDTEAQILDKCLAQIDKELFNFLRRHQLQASVWAFARASRLDLCSGLIETTHSRYDLLGCYAASRTGSASLGFLLCLCVHSGLLRRSLGLKDAQMAVT